MSPLENGQAQAEFGSLLRRFRLAVGLSQEALAERARMSPVSIGALERGARRAPYRQTVALLAEALQLASDDRARFEAAALRRARLSARGISEDEGPRQDNLPLPLTSFHGRERDIATLCTLFHERRLVTLCGVGGVGKTRLAIEAARTIAQTMAEPFTEGVWLVELAPLVDPALVASRIASVLGVQEQPGTPALETLVAALRRKRLLLALDNCEHMLVTAAAAIRQLTERCPGVCILATSREPLRVPGERVERVASLAVPAFNGDALPSIEALRASPAVRLFFDRTADIVPGFTVHADDPSERRALVTVCRRLEGIPLAIELAAGRMSALSLGALAQRLDDRFRLLASGDRTAAPRQQTLRATLDWSYGLLSEREQLLFQRLGIFAGGWTLEAAQGVCSDEHVAPGDVLDLLPSLVDKSLVVAETEDAEPRYRLLETMRAYALERLAERGGETERIARRHAEHYRAAAERVEAAFGTIPTPQWLAMVGAELDNFRAALAWAFAEGNDAEIGSAIAAALGWTFERLGLYAEGERWCERALTALGDRLSAAREAALQYALARLYVQVRGPRPARAAAERAVELYRALGDRPMLANALSWLGYAMYQLGRREEADRVASEALSMAREQSNPRWLAWALRIKGLTTDPSDTATRYALLNESLAVYRSAPAIRDFGVAIALQTLSQVAFEAGDLQRAREYARSSIAERSSLRAVAVLSLTKLAASALAIGDADEARAAAHEALEIATTGLTAGVSVAAMQSLCGVAALRGDTSRAARLLGACDARSAIIERRRDAVEEAVHQQTLTLLRAMLRNEDELAGLIAEGRTWSAEQAVEEALAVE